jgi:hypothetical protein
MIKTRMNFEGELLLLHEENASKERNPGFSSFFYLGDTNV